MNVKGAETPSGGLDDIVRHEVELRPLFDGACAAIRNAVRNGVVSKADGRLIIETRLLGRSFEEIVKSEGIVTKSLRRRERAKANTRTDELLLPM